MCEKFSGVKAAGKGNAVCQFDVSILTGTEKGNVALRNRIYVKWNLRKINLSAHWFIALFGLLPYLEPRDL